MSTITWLHLSDLHYCSNCPGWDPEAVLGDLRADLSKVERDHGLTPDLLLFTGDLALGQDAAKGWGLSEQFRQVNRFLEDARKSFRTDIPKENVFLVPGNHDVNRDVITAPLTEWLRSEDREDQVLEMMAAGNETLAGYFQRLLLYQQFLKDGGFEHLLGDPSRLVYGTIRRIRGIRVGIAGLNSAWSSGEDGAKGKLWLGGDWQIPAVRQTLRDADFTIALMHHPPNWLVAAEDRKIRERIEATYTFFLHGHEHRDWVTEIAPGHTTIAAAACYRGSKKGGGYNIVRLDFDRLEGEVWLREYRMHGKGGWVPNVMPNDRTDNNGRWSLLNAEEWMRRIAAPGTPGKRARTSVLVELVVDGDPDDTAGVAAALVRDLAQLLRCEPVDLTVEDAAPDNSVKVRLRIAEASARRLQQIGHDMPYVLRAAGIKAVAFGGDPPVTVVDPTTREWQVPSDPILLRQELAGLGGMLRLWNDPADLGLVDQLLRAFCGLLLAKYGVPRHSEARNYDVLAVLLRAPDPAGTLQKRLSKPLADDLHAVGRSVPDLIDMIAGISAAIERRQVSKAEVAGVQELLQRLYDMCRDLLRGTDPQAEEVLRILAKGESQHTEFKSSLRYNIRTKRDDDRLEMAVLKTIAGFMNYQGGTLFVGVDDKGQEVGIRDDILTLGADANQDDFLRHFVQLVIEHIGPEYWNLLHPEPSFVPIRGETVFVVHVKQSIEPVVVASAGTEKVWVRLGSMTKELLFRDAWAHFRRRTVPAV